MPLPGAGTVTEWVQSNGKIFPASHFYAIAIAAAVVVS
jgi:hypothetical protein